MQVLTEEAEVWVVLRATSVIQSEGKVCQRQGHATPPPPPRTGFVTYIHPHNGIPTCRSEGSETACNHSITRTHIRQRHVWREQRVM